MIPDVERRLFDGRSLVGHTTPAGDGVMGWPELAAESVRAINHLTVAGPIPAPTLYRILGGLTGVGRQLPQVLAQLARGLEESLRALNVYDMRRDPCESVTEAVLLLNQALRTAVQLGELLEAAQTAINAQGYQAETDPGAFVDQARVGEWAP